MPSLRGPDSYESIDLAPCDPAGGGFAESDLAGGDDPAQASLDTTSIVRGALASGPVSHDAISLHAVRGDLSFTVALRGSPPGALTPAERRLDLGAVPRARRRRIFRFPV